ncbi:hypothetical protein [Umezawaea beigongshangensis]|uniref:hypothetical protein n=1 Tax=Umezawaea beigongshangensis TaxID=2780383 RepID=UPI0018F11620|nr:hypothetical protein [Umezawaea beigongshangensis]
MSHPSRRTVLGAGAATVAGLTTGLTTGLPTSTASATAARAGHEFLRDTFGPVAGWQRQGVVMQQSLPWETSLLQDPCLVYDEGGGPRFKMWYGSLYFVGYATSEDGRKWTKAPEPVLVRSLDSDRNNLNQPSVVHLDGTWHMTYFGIDGEGRGRVHYASASAPGGPWTKHGVVLESTMPWEDDYVYNSALMYDRGERTWKIWYTAGKIASAGGEPEYICYATAKHPAGPWTKHPANPVVRPMRDGGWASLGIGGPNVRRTGDGGYEMRVVGWQADYPSRGGKLLSRDGVTWELTRSAHELDLGVAGGPEDSMVYRQFVVRHAGVDHVYYNVKNNRPGWNETIQLAVWREAQQIVDPAKWTMTQGWAVPSGASFTVGGNRATTLGNGVPGSPQTLQGNVAIPFPDYELAADVTPLSADVADRDTVLMARCTGRDSYYYAGIASWGDEYAIGVVADGVNTKIAGVGDAAAVVPGTTRRLRFTLIGSTLTLHDGDRLVLTAVDPTLIPRTSYVGLQCSTHTGRSSFGAVSVRRRS